MPKGRGTEVHIIQRLVLETGDRSQESEPLCQKKYVIKSRFALADPKSEQRKTNRGELRIESVTTIFLNCDMSADRHVTAMSAFGSEADTQDGSEESLIRSLPECLLFRSIAVDDSALWEEYIWTLSRYQIYVSALDASLVTHRFVARASAIFLVDQRLDVRRKSAKAGQLYVGSGLGTLREFEVHIGKTTKFGQIL